MVFNPLMDHVKSILLLYKGAYWYFLQTKTHRWSTFICSTYIKFSQRVCFFFTTKIPVRLITFSEVMIVVGCPVMLQGWEVVTVKIPLQTKHLMWKCLFWTRSASPLQGFPQFWQGIGPPPPPCFCFCFCCSRGLWTACCWNTEDRQRRGEDDLRSYPSTHTQNKDENSQTGIWFC